MVAAPRPLDPLASFGLDQERSRVARTTDRHVLLLAGPGAGKTHLLTAHAAWLAHLDDGLVVMLTFSNKAAAEMRARVDAAVSRSDSRRVVAQTLHAHAMSLLRAHGQHLGLPASTDILEKADVQALADGLAREHRVAALDDFADRFERFQRRGGRVDAAMVPPLVALVVAEMRRRGRFDWNTCIRLATELLITREAVSRTVRHHERFVLLDEAQDCDAAQLAFVDALVGGPKGSTHLCIAMDADQSLYKFRDADPDKVLGWAKTYQPQPVELTENHRCAPRIQALASRVIERPYGGGVDPGVARWLSSPDETAEARMVCDQIVAACRRMLPDRIAVLSRRRARLNALEAALRAAGVPVRSDAAPLDRRGQIVALGVEFLATLDEGRPARFSARPFLEALPGIGTNLDERIAEADAQGVHFGELLDVPEWLEMRRWLEAPRAPEEIVRRLAQLANMTLEDGDDILALAREEHTFKSFVRTLRAPTRGASAAGVVLTTFHGAKGLEFDLVVVLGCEDGVIPDWRSREPADVLADRRALYVALTRAAHEVVLTGVTRNQSGVAQKPSRFVPVADDPLWSTVSTN